MEKLKSGDTVQLKSGGPIMTVNNYIVNDYSQNSPNEPKNVSCKWFTDGKVQTESFHEDTLILIDKP